MPKVAHYKEEAYQQALSFRRRGFTYREIAKICNVSVSTLSNWLAHEPFSTEVAKDNIRKATNENTKRLVLINKARISERKLQYSEVVRQAVVEYQNYHTNPLFIAGIMVYASQGDVHNEKVIRLSNSRTDQHRIFIRFLTTYLGVEKAKIRIWLLLYPDHDEIACMKHWCKKTGISVAQFYKNQVITSRSHKPTLHFGVGNTIIGSTLLKKKLMRWIELATKELEK